MTAARPALSPPNAPGAPYSSDANEPIVFLISAPPGIDPRHFLVDLPWCNFTRRITRHARLPYSIPPLRLRLTPEYSRTYFHP